jgi:uncharacterized protein YoxC
LEAIDFLAVRRQTIDTVKPKVYNIKRIMNTDEKILKVLEALQADVTGIKDVQQKQGTQLEALQADVQKQGKQIDRLVDTVGHINTALKTVATKQDVEVAVDAAKSELEAKIGEVKADVLMLDSKVVKKIQSLNRRTTNIEEQSGIENPEKH